MLNDSIKKKLCIIHIGMPKTGSSALQESLFSNIIDSRVSYANLPTANHSAIMFSLFSSWPEKHHYHEGMKRSCDEIAEFNKKNKKLLIQGFLNPHSDIEIISGEDIFHIDEEGLYRMKDFLQDYFERILIAGYIRSPKSFMESAFQQLVKNHSMDRFNFSVIYPHYRMKLEKFDKVFHFKNVHLWKFDPKTFPHADITLDFCKRLNIKTDKKHVLRSNDAISQEAISLLFANHRYGNKFDFGVSGMQINNIVVKTISQIGTTKFKFSNALTDSILGKYKADINWIENRMGFSLSEFSDDAESDIRSEKELLEFSDKTINELKELIGKPFLPKAVLSNSPEDVAKLVDALKIKTASGFRIKLSKITKTWADEVKIKLADRVEVQSIEIPPKKKEISSAQAKSEYKIIKNFPINWRDFHETNGIEDVAIDPVTHYINNWRAENLIIENVFDTFYYLDSYPDIKKANINPLIHYFLFGRKEGRKGIE